MSRICRHQPPPTDEQRAQAREIAANGGSLTADELAHSAAFEYVGSSWSRARAQRSIAERQAEGKWLDAHCHGNGQIYLPREPTVCSDPCAGGGRMFCGTSDRDIDYDEARDAYVHLS